MNQRTMDDMISYFNREVSKMDIKHEDKIKLLGMITAIGYENKKQERNWIPCTERLPEEDGCYLVTTTGTNNDIIDIAYYTTDLWHKASRIKAWMPLPEPYKEGE